MMTNYISRQAGRKHGSERPTIPGGLSLGRIPDVMAVD